MAPGVHRRNAIHKAELMQGDKPDLDKQFDALVAQLPRRRRRRRRALPWILGLMAAFGVSALLFNQLLPTSKRTARVSFPLAICGNGKIEPGEDCELGQPNCPADCIRRAESVESTTPSQGRQRKE